MPGVTPPTTLVPYSRICLAWKVPAEPVIPWTMSLVCLSDEDGHGQAAFPAASATTLLGAVGHVAGGGDRQARLGEHLLAQLDVGPFQAHDQRHLQPDLLDRGDDARRDGVALHDAAEDVDEDAASPSDRR